MIRSSALRRPPAPLPSAPAGEAGAAVERDRRRGRGAHSNATGRYEALARVAFDDGSEKIEDLPPFKTTVTADATRKIITRNDSPDISFDRSINPYRGCEHGCVHPFRATDACLSRVVARARFRIEAVHEAERAGTFGARIVGAGLCAEGHRHRHQHRSVSADRAAPSDHAPHSGSAGTRRPSGRHRHQVGAGATRPRHSRPHGQA